MQITNRVTFEHWPISSHIHSCVPQYFCLSPRLRGDDMQRWSASKRFILADELSRWTLSFFLFPSPPPRHHPSRGTSRNILFIIKAITNAVVYWTIWLRLDLRHLRSDQGIKSKRVIFREAPPEKLFIQLFRRHLLDFWLPMNNTSINNSASVPVSQRICAYNFSFF